MKYAQRGSILLYLVLALAILGILAGIAYKIRQSGYDAAMLEVAERDRKAQEQEDARRAKLEETALAASKAAIRNEQNALLTNQAWQETRNAIRRTGRPLIVVECNAPPEEPPATGVARAPARTADPRLRLSWELVSLWDSAWTGEDGQPLFAGDLQRGGVAAGGDAGATSPYDPDDLVDNHGANAKACSTVARRLNALTKKIRMLRDAWKAPPAS